MVAVSWFAALRYLLKGAGAFQFAAAPLAAIWNAPARRRCDAAACVRAFLSIGY
jgi:hypothetical protein